MNTELTFGLSPQRIKELLACLPAKAEAYDPSTLIGVHLSKAEWKRVRSRRNVIEWRERNLELSRQRVRDHMRKRRAEQKARGEVVR